MASNHNLNFEGSFKIANLTNILPVRALQPPDRKTFAATREDNLINRELDLQTRSQSAPGGGRKIGDFSAGGSAAAATASPLQPSPLGRSLAIIGLGCRFPGANNPEAFWQLLRDGKDAITEVPPERWDINAFYDPNLKSPGKMNTRWGGFLEQVDLFDPHFFGISPREAERMDPQQRLLLEVSWEALENAGIAPEQLAGSQTGVFFGISNNDYSRLQSKTPADVDAYTVISNADSIAANRLSYVLDLRGPSLIVDTACSSSLVALHQAYQSLRLEECNMAIVGGVNLILSPELTISFSQARMMAADGRCKTFAADADGYVRGEGCGVVILKRLSDALRDNDNILALIRGSAINQDGRSNGLTAPNGPAQQAVIRQALKNAGVAPEEISYVETHGTGTALGDPIEVKSLKAVLQPGRSPDKPCVLGALKANIGHLEAAAGIASLIKAVLCLQHKEIPPQLHLNQLNKYIYLDKTAFLIPKNPQPWHTDCKSRFAGVSSFGFGGTNAHVVLQESPITVTTLRQIERPLHILTLSAKSENALRSLAHRYQKFLATQKQAALSDICFTANTGRSHFNHRLAITAESTVELQQKLGAFPFGKSVSGLISGQVRNNKRPKIVFLFTGQGSQYPDMGRHIYETQPTFRRVLERCEELLRPYLDQPLLSILYPAPDAPPLLHETAYTQPALFALEYALAELWRSWGIVPDAVMGHSLGEYVAACVAGVFSLEDGLKLVAQRSRLMQSLPQDGEMAVVLANAERVAAVVAPYRTQVAIAAVNGSQNTVISGVRSLVQSVVEELKAQEGISVKRLQVSHAFHSPLIEPIVDEFERVATQVQFKAPDIALISNLTGQKLKPGEIPDANYWRRHMREPVQFAAGINAIAQQDYEIFLELGPSTTLLGMGKRCLPKQMGIWLPSLQPGQEDWRIILNSLAVLETQGVNVNWSGFDRDYQRRRVVLPTYPFERKRYWFESSEEGRRTESPTDFQQLKQESGQNEPQRNKSLKKEFLRKSDTGNRQIEGLEAKEKSLPYADQIRSELQNEVAGLLKTDLDDIDIYTPFLEMGADSIVLMEVVQTIESTFGIKSTIRQLFEELTTIDALADYIAKTANASKEVARSPERGWLQGEAPCSGVRSTSRKIGDFSAPAGRALRSPISRDGNLPLSFAQTRLWFLEQLQPGSPTYNIPAAVRIRGILNVAALEQSFNTIIERHEALRTTFRTVNGEPVQVIAPRLSLTLPIVDLRELPDKEQETEVKRLFVQEAQQPFNLNQSPLMRVTLLQLSPNEHVLLLVMHHIISDGWSMGVLIRELAALYEALPLPELPIQYADYAHWQRQWLQTEVLTEQLAYWQKQLAGVPEVLKLPTDCSRSATPTFRGATHFLTISAPLSQKLKLLGQQSKATLFMTLLAAFQTLLYHYTRQEDFCIGSPIANRNHPKTEDLIGFFVNTQVLRANLSGDRSFREILQQVRETALGAYAHQDLPFEKLVEKLQPDRNLGYTPLFQVWFVLQNAPMPALEFSGLNLNILELESGVAQHDLKLDLTATPEGIKGFFEYKIDLFDATTIAEMARLFESLLSIIIEQPDIKLNTLTKVLSSANKRQEITREEEFKQANSKKLQSLRRKSINKVERSYSNPI